MLTRLLEELQLRVVQALSLGGGGEDRALLRCTCQAMRAAVARWEREAPMRLHAVVELVPGYTRRHHRCTTTNTLLLQGVLHVRSEPRPKTYVWLLMRPRPRTEMEVASLLRFVRDECAHDWRAVVCCLLQAIAERRLEPARVTRWAFMCVLPAVTDDSRPYVDADDGVDDALLRRLIAAMVSLRALEELRVCVMTSQHDPLQPELGERAALRRALREALPLWRHLTELTLTDFSVVKSTDNAHELVQTLGVGLTRDAELVRRLVGRWMAGHDIRPDLEAHSRPSPLRLLRLCSVWLTNDGSSVLLWLLVGAFPPARLELVGSHVRYPRLCHLATTTIFTEAFYGWPVVHHVTLDLREYTTLLLRAPPDGWRAWFCRGAEEKEGEQQRVTLLLPPAPKK